MEEEIQEDMDIESNILEDIVYSSPDISHREFYCFTYNQGSYNIYWNLYTKLVKKKNMTVILLLNWQFVHLHFAVQIKP